VASQKARNSPLQLADNLQTLHFDLNRVIFFCFRTEFSCKISVKFLKFLFFFFLGLILWWNNTTCN